MKATVDRQTAIRLLNVEHAAVRELIDELSDNEMTTPNTVRHGLYADQEWSFKDLLAHLITYEALSIEAIELWQQGASHWITNAMRSPQEGIKVHYGGVADRRAMSLQEVLNEWEETQAGLVDAISTLKDDDWVQSAPYTDSESTDLGGMLEEILVAPPRPLYRHLPVHIPDMAAYIRSLRIK